MKIREGGREGGEGVVILNKWTTHSLSRAQLFESWLALT